MTASSAVKASRDPCLTWMQTYVMPESDAARNWRYAAGETRSQSSAASSMSSPSIVAEPAPSSTP